MIHRLRKSEKTFYYKNVNSKISNFKIQGGGKILSFRRPWQRMRLFQTHFIIIFSLRDALRRSATVPLLKFSRLTQQPVSRDCERRTAVMWVHLPFGEGRSRGLRKVNPSNKFSEKNATALIGILKGRGHDNERLSQRLLTASVFVCRCAYMVKLLPLQAPTRRDVLSTNSWSMNDPRFGRLQRLLDGPEEFVSWRVSQRPGACLSHKFSYKRWLAITSRCRKLR